jgi:predicted CoA-substrate-specific enzyme activase
VYFAGLDLGSTMTKVVVIDDSGAVLAAVTRHTGAEHRRLANLVMEKALEEAGLQFEEVDQVLATGYGRINVPFADHQVTELSCHARGVAAFFPGVSLAVDIGGQDAKGLKIRQGKLVEFVMSDKCAAGTGRFLEVLASTLGIGLEELGPLSERAAGRVSISSTCTVFARQEVVARLSEGVAVEDIIAGVHAAIASRTARMVRRLRVVPDVVFTGGVAKNTGVVRALEESLDCEVLVPEQPLLTGALGAALLARQRVKDAVAAGEAIPRKERRLEAARLYG